MLLINIFSFSSITYSFFCFDSFFRYQFISFEILSYYSTTTLARVCFIHIATVTSHATNENIYIYTCEVVFRVEQFFMKFLSRSYFFKMAEFDLTEKMSQFLDLHLVIPLLEFIEPRNVSIFFSCMFFLIFIYFFFCYLKNLIISISSEETF